MYFAGRSAERIAVGDVFTDSIWGAWFDPKDGSLTAAADLRGSVSDGVLPVENDAQDGEDRILILAAEPSVIDVPCGSYGGEAADEEIRKVFAW